MNHLSLITSQWLYTLYMWVSVEDELQISDNESEKNLGNKILHFWTVLVLVIGLMLKRSGMTVDFPSEFMVKGLFSCSWCSQRCDVAQLHPVGFCTLGNSTLTDTLSHENSLEHLSSFAHFISLRLAVVVLRSPSALGWAFFILLWIFFSSSKLSSS